jgi:hypothetical protein
MKFKFKSLIFKIFLLIFSIGFSINSSFATNCSKDVKLIFEDGDERCLSEFPDFFNIHKLNEKKFDLDFFKNKKIISFASTGDQCGNGWGMSHSYTSPNENDRQALEWCQKSNVNNKCKCQILLSSDAPLGALKVKMKKEDFLAQFKFKNSPVDSIEKNKSIPKITVTEFTENSLSEINNFKFITNIPTENEIEITGEENGIYGIRTNSGRNFYLIRGVLQIVEKSEPGAVFIGKDGYFNFQERTQQISSTAVKTFADDGTGIGFNNLQVVYGSEQLYNRIVITRLNGTAQIADDTDSQNQYGVSTLDQDNLLLASDSASLDLANYLLTRYSEPEYRFEAIEIELANLPTAQQNDVLSLELTDVVRVKFTPNSIGSAIDQYALITGITHRTNSISHSVTIGLSTLDYANFILGDSVFGQLDDDRLGF